MNSQLIKILNKQKETLKELMSQSYVERDNLKEGKKMMDTDLIKVVIGPRRTGKSIFSLLLLRDINFAYLNFDEESLSPILEKMDNYNDLLESMFEIYGKIKYLFFDEIQNLDRWELFANRLHREGYNLLLTGSNAKLLSKELSTHLTGRHLSIEILPFNFKEYLKGKNSEEATTLILKEYLSSGSYPEVAVKGFDPKSYLSTLFDAIIFKDIIKRYKIRQADKIVNLAIYLINNIANEFSSRKLANILEFKSTTTVEKYLAYLEESYLFFILRRYSHKTVERMTSPKKIYMVDNGYVTAKAVQFSSNSGKFMENLVFSELIKRGFKTNIDLFYYKTRNGKEIDFIIRQGIKCDCLIQVAYDLSNSDTEKREIKALLEASGELKCENLLIITWDKEATKEIEGKKIKFITLNKWLLL